MAPTALNDKQHRSILQSIPHQAMLERGFIPDFSAEAIAKLARMGKEFDDEYKDD